jgi:type II secretion system protein I
VGDDRGFTLLEVLVASAILAGSLAALLPTLSNSLRQMRAAEAREAALLVAQSVMAGIEVDPLDAPRRGTSSGLRWSVSVTPEGSTSGDLAAYRASVVVVPENGAPVQLDTIVLGRRS